MAKILKTHIEEDVDPWLISYADMVTLLFAFFVVLASISSLNMVKYEEMTQNLRTEKRMTSKDIKNKIQEFVKQENLEDQITVAVTDKGVEINFKDKILFDIGKAELKPQALDILGEMSGLMNYKEISERKISVEGHTDRIPMKSKIYPSNWELSSGRAASVVRYLNAKGMDNRRFESIGYADTHPVKPENDDVTGEPANRRVVIVIKPDSYLSKQELETRDYSADAQRAAQTTTQTVASGEGVAVQMENKNTTSTQKQEQTTTRKEEYQEKQVQTSDNGTVQYRKEVYQRKEVTTKS